MDVLRGSPVLHMMMFVLEAFANRSRLDRTSCLLLSFASSLPFDKKRVASLAGLPDEFPVCVRCRESHPRDFRSPAPGVHPSGTLHFPTFSRVGVLLPPNCLQPENSVTYSN